MTAYEVMSSSLTFFTLILVGFAILLLADAINRKRRADQHARSKSAPSN